MWFPHLRQVLCGVSWHSLCIYRASHWARLSSDVINLDRNSSDVSVFMSPVYTSQVYCCCMHTQYHGSCCVDSISDCIAESWHVALAQCVQWWTCTGIIPTTPSVPSYTQLQLSHVVATNIEYKATHGVLTPTTASLPLINRHHAHTHTCMLHWTRHTHVCTPLLEYLHNMYT